jgi:hypothetical protein
MIRRPAFILATLWIGILLLGAPAAALAGPAQAQKAPAAAQKGPGFYFDAAELDQLEKMDPAQYNAFLAKRRAEIAKMPRTQKRKYFADRQKAFEALPAEQRAALNARVRKLGAAYTAAHKEEWAKNRAAAKAFEAEQHKKFMKEMPGIERAVLQRYKELRKTHSKDYAWRLILDDARKGGRLKPLAE